MSLALARALVLTEVVPWSPVAQALFVSVTKNVPFVQALLESRAVSLERIEEELARADAPIAESVAMNVELLERLPRGLCARLLAVPLKRQSNCIDVALVDARDEHAIRELGYHLKAKVRVFRAPFRKVQELVAGLPMRPREDSIVESTLVSIRAPEGILLPPSERGSRAPVPPPGGNASRISRPPVSGSAPPLPLVRRASELQPIPLVRRADEQPVLELRSPFSRPARSFIESPAVAQMRTAQDRDEILKLLLEGSMERAKRVVLFAVRRDAFTGLLCTPTMGDVVRIREVRLPLDGPSIFATVASGGTYMGPIYNVEAHKPILALLPHCADTVAVAAVRLRGRPLVLVLAEGMPSPVQDVRTIEDLARCAGDAFARILSAKGE